MTGVCCLLAVVTYAAQICRICSHSFTYGGWPVKVAAYLRSHKVPGVEALCARWHSMLYLVGLGLIRLVILLLQFSDNGGWTQTWCYSDGQIC